METVWNKFTSTKMQLTNRKEDINQRSSKEANDDSIEAAEINNLGGSICQQNNYYKFILLI